MIEMVDLLKALADETRLRIMALLCKKEMCVCELCEVLEESQPKVSRHLAMLRSMGLVQDERRSQWVFYSPTQNNNAVFDIMRIVTSNAPDNPVFFRDLQRMDEKTREGKFCNREGIQS